MISSPTPLAHFLAALLLLITAISAEENTDPANIKTRLLFSNGDKLSGQLQSFDNNNNLLFESDSLRQTASFPLKNILSIFMDSWKQAPARDTLAHVQLYPRFREPKGDTIIGALHELTPDSIKLDTWYGGIITLQRPMVKSLKIISNTPGNYNGPNNLKEWTSLEDKKSWSFENGTLIAAAAGDIGKDVGLRQKSHISFNAKWKSSMRFKIRLYTSIDKEKIASDFYELNFNERSIYLNTWRNKQLLGGGRWQKKINNSPIGNQAHFDLFADRKSGSINVYIDGLHACLLQSNAPNAQELGTGLSFLAEKRYPLEISAISVSPWNGLTLPKPIGEISPDDLDLGKKEPATENTPPHKIILKNGDEIPGTVGKVQDNRMIVETQFTPIRIPLNRIQSLSLGDQEVQPIMKAGDIRAWFHNGGHITFKLVSYKDGKISGYGQAFGDVTLKLSAFSRIDFRIDDTKANELREKNR